MMKRTAFLLAVAATLASLTAAAQEVAYRQPSKEVAEMIQHKPLPVLTFNGKMTYAVAAQADFKYRPLSYIESIAEYKVAGLRLDGGNFSQTRKPLYDGASVICVSDGSSKAIAGLPEGALLYAFKWSPNGRYLCFLNNAKSEVELYRVDAFAVEPKAEKINERPVNGVFFDDAYGFLSDEAVVYKSVPEGIGAFPVQELPKGPLFTSDKDNKYLYETYQDLLKSPFDEAVFEYLCTAELTVFDGSGTRSIGDKGIIRSLKPSPDGKYLIVKTIQRPYSYGKPYSEFPMKTAVVDLEGKEVKVLPKEKDGVKLSDWGWRADCPSTLFWFEKREGKDNEARTSLCQCAAPFDGREVILTPEYDINSVIWGTESIALYTERSKTAKMRRTYSFNPSDIDAPHVLLRSEDTYNLRPYVTSFVGDFVVNGGNGTVTMDPKHTFVLMSGDNRLDENGAKHFFLDKISLKDGKATNIWNAKAPFKSTVLGVTAASDKGITFITRKESPKDVPNYTRIDIDKKGKMTERVFTSFENPLPHLDGIREEFLKYRRADGVECSARLYLPADWDKNRDGALPVFMWTYPRDHYTKESAEMNYKADPYKFAMPDQSNQIFWCLKGYAVVLDWTMANLAKDKDGDFNVDFVGQVVMNAEAVIDALVEQGYGDRNRMSVGGLSYGSFMTGNLLAHTDLYKCGFCNSGAFNRTLTPFGFQWYEKTYWESMDIYNAMSPFNFADKIKEPVLITHGMMDENTGTYPIQSERLYYGIIGNGGQASYLQLPYEGHQMAFEENVLHYFSVVEEMLDKYVKNAK